MKIQGPGGTKGPSKTSKSGKVSSTGANFGDFMAKDASRAGATQNTQSIAQVDALLAIQGAEDPAQGKARRQVRQRAGVILDELDKIRMAMLSGKLTVGHMIDIADVIASHREKIMDPALTDIMDEIDLRAQVELAKMRVALDARN
ncbi:MAG: flagellar assembly protein FliX [Rhodospirillales bacterium]|nr:flagellar assembly protein FliX [Rhodospirillales bacterium]